MNSKTINTLLRALACSALAPLIILTVVGQASAQTILQGYDSDTPLQKGMLVTLKKDDSTKLEPLTNETADMFKGVVVDSADSPLTLSSSGQRQTFIAQDGRYEVLVSNENGKIRQGDFIAVSSLAGIGMKATNSQAVVYGKAVKNYEGAGDSLGKTAVGDKMISFGRIAVDLGVTSNPNLKASESTLVPEALKNLATGIADKDVSAARIYLAMTVLVVTAIVASVTMFSGVRSSVISIGRNPLSKGVITKGLLQVLLLSLIIFITGLFGVYLLIRL